MNCLIFNFCVLHSFESFNSQVRTFNIFSNRQAQSRDIAIHFSRLQDLRYLSHCTHFSDNKRLVYHFRIPVVMKNNFRCAVGVQEILSSSVVQHALSGTCISFQQLNGDRGIYQPGAARKVWLKIYFCKINM